MTIISDKKENVRRESAKITVKAAAAAPAVVAIAITKTVNHLSMMSQSVCSTPMM